MKMRYRLQRRERSFLPNILGNHSIRYKDIALGESIEALQAVYPEIITKTNGLIHLAKGYRIEDTKIEEEK